MTSNNPPSRIEAVHRALVLLKMIADQGSVSVTEAAQALDINPSSAQRILATLTQDGFALQGDRRRYEAGPAYLRPGMMHQMPLRVHARPFLERLYTLVGETVHLIVLIGTEIHYVDGIEATQPLRYQVRTGERLPAERTSSGKAMMAELPWEAVVARYEAEAADSSARTQPIDLNHLRSELERTRQRGVGLNVEESGPGIAGLGVSLGIINGESAAFSLTMPISRYTPAHAEACSGHLLEVATEYRKRLAA